MIALLQRVSTASVEVSRQRVGAIEKGLVVFVGVERDDEEPRAVRLAERVLVYRVFADAAGKMNLSVRDVDGGLLLVPQFTLAADTSKGTRASFSSAADPEKGQRLFATFVTSVRRSGLTVATGVFAANMSVTLINEGPVTFWLSA